MPLMTKAGYAEHRKALNLAGGSAPGVLLAVKSGRISQVLYGNKYLIDSEQADKDWEANTKNMRPGAGAKKEDPAPKVDHAGRDYNESRAVKEYYESELSRLKYEEKQGTLIPAEVVKKVLYAAGRVIRAGHSDIVAQLAPVVASTMDIPTVEAHLKKALDKISNEFADHIDRLGEELLAETEAANDN